VAPSPGNGRNGSKSKISAGISIAPAKISCRLALIATRMVRFPFPRSIYAGSGPHIPSRKRRHGFIIRALATPVFRRSAMTEDFYRIKRLPPYVFAEVNALKAKARAAGRDVIDLGMGNPDGATPPHIVAKLVEAVQNQRAHGYSVSRGIAGLRRAQAAYYRRRFNVDLDPESEVIVTLGSKEGLANLAQAITAPGDVVLVPSPCYPIHAFGFIIAGATVRYVPAGPGVDFLAGLKTAVAQSTPKPVAVVLNYPANPTAEVVGLDFYAEVVNFCREQGIYILSDVAYAEIYFNDEPPPSILEVPGARDIAVEFSSLSKTYNMAGWRIGFAVGNKRLIAALARVKSYLDYGAF